MSNPSLLGVMQAAVAAGLSFPIRLQMLGILLNGWLSIEQHLLTRVSWATLIASFSECVSRITGGNVGVAVSAVGSSLHVCLIPAGPQTQLILPGRAGQTAEEAMAWSCVSEVAQKGSALLARAIRSHDAAIAMRESAEASGGISDDVIDEAQRAARCSRAEVLGAKGLIEFSEWCTTANGSSSCLHHILPRDIIDRIERDGKALLAPIRVLHSVNRTVVATISGFQDRKIYLAAEDSRIAVAV